MTLELFFKADKIGGEENATFIGECFIPWKRCMEEGKYNEW
jgi:hypothetical protein